MADHNLTLPGSGPRIHDLARRLGLAGFWSWWRQRLDALVPATPRAAMARRRMKPVLVFDGDQATLWRPGLEQQQAVMREAIAIALTGDAGDVTAAGRAALASFAPGVRAGDSAAARVVVSLRPRDVLRRKIVLPIAVEENLRQALAYDLDRHTPFKAEELYFDAVIVERDVARGTIAVDLAAARRSVVDPLLKHVAAWGGEVVAVVPELPMSAALSRLNLLPLDSRNGRSWWGRWQFWLPVALCAAMVIAALLIPLWQKREYAIALNAVVDQARAQAAVSERLREELDARVGDYNAVLERKYAYPSALQVVDNVSKLLPDDTWLTQFELKTVARGKEMQRELLVRGETANAGRLVQLFEESQLFAQASPRSPTTKIQPGPGEIFDLGAQLKPLPAPPRLPLVVAEAGGPAPVDSALAPPPAAIAPSAAAPAPPSQTAPPAAAQVAPAAAQGAPAAAQGGPAPPTSTATSPAPVPANKARSAEAPPASAVPSPSAGAQAQPPAPAANRAAPAGSPKP